MFAVIRSGGKQYRVSVGDVLTLEKLDARGGALVDFTDVLLVGGDGAPKIGAPTVPDAVVRADVVGHLRGPKVVSFKRRRRKASSKRMQGHRQDLTQVKIVEIGSAKPARAAQAEAAAANTTASESTAAKASKKPSAAKPAAKPDAESAEGGEE